MEKPNLESSLSSYFGVPVEMLFVEVLCSMVGPMAGWADFGVVDSEVADSVVVDSEVADSVVADSVVADSEVADSVVANSGSAGFVDSGVACSGVAYFDFGYSGFAGSDGTSRRQLVVDFADVHVDYCFRVYASMYCLLRP
jgi:hypothetical protein